MYGSTDIIIQLGALLTVGIAIVSSALFMAWRDAQRSRSAFQRKRRRRRAFVFRTFKPPELRR